MSILVFWGETPLAVYNQNTVDENGDIQPLNVNNVSQTVSNTATVTSRRLVTVAVLLTVCDYSRIYGWFAVDFFARGLHARSAVARLPLR